MLIDGGGTISYRKPGEEWKNRRDPFEVGSKVVVPLLMKRGVRELDVLVVSHLDSDHIRGLQAVLAAIPVKEIWWNGTLKKSEDTEKLFKAATAANIPIYAVHSGMKAALDPHSFVQVLWPKEGAQADRPLAAVKDQNNISVVLAITMYNATFVFAGDIDMKTERQIIGQAGIFPASETEKPAVLLKIAHHGSRFSTSEQWLSYWSPIGAVASVGASNSYGHPHRDVIGRVEAARALLWRTDMDGEIRFRMTHDGINVYK